LGRAKSGKTKLIMDDIKRRADSGETGLTLIVPEQYSHNAERQLCAVVGDALSLHGEVLSFTRLCSRVFAETGGGGDTLLDAGGQIGVLYRAISEVSDSLKVYGNRDKRADFLEKLLMTVREFKLASLDADALGAASKRVGTTLADKLSDLTLITAAYDAFLRSGGSSDPCERLTRLAENIGDSSYVGAVIYIDGFHDFTSLELRVITELIKRGANVTVCLTCDGLYGDEEVFSVSRGTAVTLHRLAEAYGGCEIVNVEPRDETRRGAFEFLERHMFSRESVTFTGESGIEIYAAPSAHTECEYAAALIRGLVKDGYRYRDIAVMFRGAPEYASACENVFERYDIPVFSSVTTDILQKPPVALIMSALDIINYGWEYDNVFRYLKTYLTGITPNDCDALENYVLRWNICGTQWTREAPFPFGRGEDESRDTLLDALRKAVSTPIEALRKALKKEPLCSGKVRALYAFLEQISLPDTLRTRADALRESGFSNLSAQYEQLWDIIVAALTQLDEFLGECAVTDAEFSRVLSLLLSQYDIGVIPLALDNVMVGDMSRSRRRDIKCLIVLGASDELLPRAPDMPGVLSDAERGELIDAGLTLSGGTEMRLYSELNTIYSSLTLPSDKLLLLYPEGGGSRPSYIVTRIASLFGLAPKRLTESEYMSAAQRPCFELAVSERGGDTARAAREYFLRGISSRETLERAISASVSGRGSLSGTVSSRLFGDRIRISATQAEKFYSCKYAYFLKNGLRLSKRAAAEFDAPEAGTFMHFVLEGVTREITDTVGFERVTDDAVAALTQKHVAGYIARFLPDLDERTERYRYLFHRVTQDTRRVVIDMVRELARSSFRPLNFELKFDASIPLSGDASGELTISGVVDRVDGWVHDGRQYLRVIDYKTGKKSFKLSDLWYGMGMQMLIYMYALALGETHADAVPSGVLYAPARDVMASFSRDMPDEAIEAELAKKLRRSGIVLQDADVIEAMEKGGDKRYIPVKFKDGRPVGDALLSANQIGKLFSHVGNMLENIPKELRRGNIAAEPYYKNAADNACTFCDYRPVCNFDETRGDRPRYAPNLSGEEFWQKLGEVEK
jgi:ATP-dependent helicase/nuclease subunit B